MNKVKNCFGALLLLLLMCVGFVSCNSESDVPEQKVTYNIKMSRSEMVGSADIATYRSEYEEIMNTYAGAFNANQQYVFTMSTENVAELNNQVLTVASQINVYLQNKEWVNRYTVEIDNNSTGEVVFKATYEPKQ